MLFFHPLTAHKKKKETVITDQTRISGTQVKTKHDRVNLRKSLHGNDTKGAIKPIHVQKTLLHYYITLLLLLLHIINMLSTIVWKCIKLLN